MDAAGFLRRQLAVAGLALRRRHASSDGGSGAHGDEATDGGGGTLKDAAVGLLAPLELLPRALFATSADTPLPRSARDARTISGTFVARGDDPINASTSGGTAAGASNTRRAAAPLRKGAKAAVARCATTISAFALRAARASSATITARASVSVASGQHTRRRATRDLRAPRARCARARCTLLRHLRHYPHGTARASSALCARSTHPTPVSPTRDLRATRDLRELRGTRVRPARDLRETCAGPARDLRGTCAGPARDRARCTSLRHRVALPGGWKRERERTRHCRWAKRVADAADEVVRSPNNGTVRASVIAPTTPCATLSAPW
jgi:hypothetical protein